MNKMPRHYVDYCRELGLNEKDGSNVKVFLEDDTVYVNTDGELFIDKDNEMISYGNGLYYHENFNVPEGASKDMLVDIPLYHKLEKGDESENSN